MYFDPLQYRYPSRRSVVYGKRGMVCTSQTLAAQAGLDILKQGGNAVDAMLATAICMAVLEPTSNGLGSDTFALVWREKEHKLYGLNGSGYAPRALTPEAMQAKGYARMPERGWTSVTVPGAPAAWAELHQKFGRLPFEKLFAPAIAYAEDGFPLQPIVGLLWQQAEKVFEPFKERPAFKPFFETFLRFGGKSDTSHDESGLAESEQRKTMASGIEASAGVNSAAGSAYGAPAIGSMVKLPELAQTLRELAATHCESFYRGQLAQAMDKFSKETGGYLRAEDLAAYRAEWVEPLHTNYKGYEVYELPPNGHGLVVLMTLNILQALAKREQGRAGEPEALAGKAATSAGGEAASADSCQVGAVGKGAASADSCQVGAMGLGAAPFLPARDDPATIHQQLEAMKLAYADGLAYIADPRCMQMSVDYLLSQAYAQKRSAEIGPEAILPQPVDPNSGGTVYMCAADEEGNMISLIQSNFKGFGSGIVIPGTGISLNDRACSFSLDPAAANCLAPGKKPYHTIIPGFLMKDGEALGPFGVMGAFMQPQGHVQVLQNLIDFGLNPQEALDAPRWQWIRGKRIELEAGFGDEVAAALRKRGHEVTMMKDLISFGRGQMILKGRDGVFCGATEPRTDGGVAAW